jgi:MFS family permease
LVTTRFVLIVGSALFFFMAFTMLVPTLPRWLESDLSASSSEIGIVVGSFSLAAALLRPPIGRLGDRYGRRVLLICGVATIAVTVALYPLFATIPALIVLRLAGGLGETGGFVGAATATQDLAPPHRRGEAASYFSVAVYAALGLGPVLGEWLYTNYGFGAVTRASAAFCVVSILFGLSLPGRPEPSDKPLPPRRGFLHPAAVWPGLLLTLSLIGFTGYLAFLATYMDRLGAGNAGTVFLVYSAIVLTFRIGLARLPDRLGARRGSLLAFFFITIGFTVVAAWGTVTGVYVGTALLAVGVAFNYPALFLFVMAKTDDSERSHSVASFGFFFDVAGVIGAPLLGVIIDVTGSERPAFAVGALAAAVGLLAVPLLAEPRPTQPGADAEPAPRPFPPGRPKV